MSSPPDGIGESNYRDGGPLRHHASPLAFLLLGGLLAAAAAGLLGGMPNPATSVSAPSASLTIEAPATVRNGVFFETRIRVAARRSIAEPVIGISPAYWRDLTINSQVPAAADESFEDGLFRFAYPPLAAGQVLEIKIDGQVNPPLFAGTAGEIALFDGDREIVRRPVAMRVLP